MLPEGTTTKEVEEEEEEETVETVEEETQVQENQQEKTSKEEEQQEDSSKKKPIFEERQQQMRHTTWEMRDAERKADAAAQRANDAASRLEVANAKAGNPKPLEDDFDTQAEFVKALVGYEVKQTLNEQQVKPQPKAEPRREEALREWGFKVQKVAEKYPDYAQNEEHVKRTLDYYKNPEIADILIESAQGPEVVQYLGKNTDELERIAKLSPLSAAKEIGKIEDKLTSKPVKKQTTAKPPVSPVSGGGSATTDYSKMSTTDFMKARNEALYGKK